MYAEADSDDDSDFEQIYKSPPDNYADLKPLQDKPIFMSDLIQAF